jgi:hypothetical protein
MSPKHIRSNRARAGLNRLTQERHNMFERPPQEKQWQSWLSVVVWTLFIFVSIPLARTIQQYVYEEWNRNLFTYVVLLITALGLVAATLYVRRFRPAARSGYFWLAAISGIFVVYAIELGNQSPEEAIHFVQYGVLGILVYRALAHRVQDISIYFAAAIICGIIGAIDEFVQWLTPRRVWGLRDIWLNFFSSAIVQIAIAKGLQPSFIGRRFSRANLQILCRLGIAAAAILGACLLITPPRIAWFADRIGWLEFLKDNDSVMLEYGYLYEDPHIGVFRSRFAAWELKEIDRRRAVEAADILNRFQDKDSYRMFLSLYTPISDPFVHEARVHLFRRDRHFDTALEHEDDPAEFVRRLTIAWRENQIMEKYFSNTLRHSDYVWSNEKSAMALQKHLPDVPYNSGVSRNLITRVREWQVVSLFFTLILLLVLFHGYLGKMPDSRSSLDD